MLTIAGWTRRRLAAAPRIPSPARPVLVSPCDARCWMFPLSLVLSPSPFGPQLSHFALLHPASLRCPLAPRSRSFGVHLSSTFDVAALRPPSAHWLLTPASYPSLPMSNAQCVMLNAQWSHSSQFALLSNLPTSIRNFTAWRAGLYAAIRPICLIRHISQRIFECFPRDAVYSIPTRSFWPLAARHGPAVR